MYRGCDNWPLYFFLRHKITIIVAPILRRSLHMESWWRVGDVLLFTRKCRRLISLRFSRPVRVYRTETKAMDVKLAKRVSSTWLKWHSEHFSRSYTLKWITRSSSGQPRASNVTTTKLILTSYIPCCIGSIFTSIWLVFSQCFWYTRRTKTQTPKSRSWYYDAWYIYQIFSTFMLSAPIPLCADFARQSFIFTAACALIQKIYANGICRIETVSRHSSKIVNFDNV